jgi:hypothetical protein
MVARIRGSFSERRIVLVACLAVLSMLVIAMIVFQIAYTGTSEHSAIAWNLLLAWIPFWLALIVYDRSRSGASTLTLGAAAVLWLLFLPNAPYILTDLKHIDGFSGVSAFYDVVLLASAAWTGLLLGHLPVSYACRFTAPGRCLQRLGACDRRARVELIRDLSRARPTLEFLGRLRSARLLIRRDRRRATSSAESSAPDRGHDPVHFVSAGELLGLLLVVRRSSLVNE